MPVRRRLPIEVTTFRSPKLAEVVVDDRSFKVDGTELSHMITGYECHYESGEVPEVTMHMFAPLLAEALGLNASAIFDDVVSIRVRGEINRVHRGGR